mmetsp:Transcript_706/g.1245  ORF Transcript_706/g.1245 Transcript_706/m.1245 type:complete len:96 (+) Transcript_706:274-561(+)
MPPPPPEAPTPPPPPPNQCELAILSEAEFLRSRGALIELPRVIEELERFQEKRLFQLEVVSVEVEEEDDDDKVAAAVVAVVILRVGRVWKDHRML